VYQAVACGDQHTAALRSDGLILAWGSNAYQQCSVPVLPAGLSYTGVAAGSYHTLALRSDGAVLAFGDDSLGQCTVPVPPAGYVYKQVEAGDVFSLAIRSDGRVVAWGANNYGQCNIPPHPAGFACVDLAAGEGHVFALYEVRPASTYCTAKPNSLGCVPTISSLGTPSATAGSGFTLAGYSVRNNKSGLLIYGVNGPAASPFQGGTLCVSSPIKRTGGQNSAGSSPPVNDCTGSYIIDMNAFAVSAGPPVPLPALRVAGTVVNCQFWGRDPGFPSPNNTTLSDALVYSVGP
jgi:hypothetical protein